MSRSLISCLLLFSFVSPVTAQNVAIQQPVVDMFSVDTVVSVPDGGQVFLGSIGSASDGRFDAGFSTLGSSIGTERSHQGMSVSVFIHDLDEMDRMILASGDTMENPWTGEITRGGPVVDQGGRLSLTYSARPSEPTVTDADDVAPDQAGDFDPRGTAAFRTLQSRFRD